MARFNWPKHLEEHKKSGLSVAEYCAKHRLGPSAFYHARKRLQDIPSFTPLVIKDASKKLPCFEVTLVVVEGGLVEFRGLTNDKGFLSALLQGATA